MLPSTVSFIPFPEFRVMNWPDDRTHKATQAAIEIMATPDQEAPRLFSWGKFYRLIPMNQPGSIDPAIWSGSVPMNETREISQCLNEWIRVKILSPERHRSCGSFYQCGIHCEMNHLQLSTPGWLLKIIPSNSGYSLLLWVHKQDKSEDFSEPNQELYEFIIYSKDFYQLNIQGIQCSP